MWNNSGAGANIAIDTNCGNDPTLTANVFNNIVDCSNGNGCYRVVDRGSSLGTLNLKNNLWIAAGTRPTRRDTPTAKVGSDKCREQYDQERSERHRQGIYGCQ